MRLGINRARLFEGESLLLTVRVSGASQPPEPDVSGIDHAAVEFLGSQSLDQVSVTVVRGQVRKTGFFGRLFSYRITPDRKGEFQIGPVRLALPDRTLVEQGPTITVQGIEEQDDVIVEVVASRETVLLDESFDIALNILMKRMPGTLAALDPLDPARPPQLDVPFMEMQPIAGLDGPDLRALLRARLAQRRSDPGFAINNYTVRPDPFDEMFRFDRHREPSKARFMFERRAVERNGVPYYKYSVVLSYRPEEEGVYTFGPVMFKGDIVRNIDAGRRMNTHPVFAVGPARIVRVVPPPEEGRPLSFIGAIGSGLTASAELDTQRCKIGDPLTLTLTVSGDATLRNAHAPPIHAQPDVHSRFRVYPDATETFRQRDSVRFLYRLRPIMAGTIDLPSLAVSYYDSRERDYRTAWTKPMPIRVDDSHQIGVEDVIGLKAHEDVGALHETAPLAPAPLSVSPVGAEPKPLRFDGRHGACAVVAPGVYGFVVLLRWRRRRASALAARKRRRSALGRALAVLRDAERDADLVVRAQSVCEAMKTYLAQRLDVEPAGLTPSDARRLLARQGVEAAVVARFEAVLEAHFNAAYHGAGVGLPTPDRDDVSDVEDILRRTDADLARMEAEL